MIGAGRDEGDFIFAGDRVKPCCPDVSVDRGGSGVGDPAAGEYGVGVRGAQWNRRGDRRRAPAVTISKPAEDAVIASTSAVARRRVGRSIGFLRRVTGEFIDVTVDTPVLILCGADRQTWGSHFSGNS